MERLMEALTDFARVMGRGSDISDVLTDLAVLVPGVLGIAGAGVSLQSPKGVSFAASSSERASLLERAQQETQVGPSVTAIATGERQAVADLRTEAGRWPEHVATAQELGIMAVAALPLRNGETFGALALYDDRVHAWADDEVAQAQVFVDFATSYLLSASTLERERRTVEQLQRALENRVVIEQAKGSVAANEGISVDDAFLRLRKYARDHRANLRDVAHAVVRLGLRV